MQYRKGARTDGLHDAERLLAAYEKEHLWAHSVRVAEKAREIAAQYALDSEVAYASGLYHDIGGVMTPHEMRSEALPRGIVLDAAEEAHPFLLHQRFSRILAEETLGVRDARILSAIECHTTLWSMPSPYDMALFLADKLAWDQPGEPPYRAAIEAALNQSLECASLALIDYLLENDMIKAPHRWLLEARCWLMGYEERN